MFLCRKRSQIRERQEMKKTMMMLMMTRKKTKCVLTTIDPNGVYFFFYFPKKAKQFLAVQQGGLFQFIIHNKQCTKLCNMTKLSF